MLLKIILIGYSKIGIINAFPKFLKNNSEVEVYLNNILAENSNWETIRNIVYSICFDEQLKHCKNCGKEMKYSKGLNYNYCSNKCTANSKEVQESIKQTNLERYGCEYLMQNKEFQDKCKQTNLEKYGYSHPFQSEKIKKLHHNKSYDYLIPKFIEQGITPLFSKEEYNGWDKIYK